MNTSPPQRASTKRLEPVRSSQRGFYIILAIMFLLFAGVVWQRHRLRAHWWSIQLASATQIEDKAECIARIADQGPSGRAVLLGLVGHNDKEVRQMLLAVLPGLPLDQDTSRAYSHLLHDLDAEVRETATLDLTFRDLPAANELLVTCAQQEKSLPAALTALAALRRVGTEAAANCMSAIISSSPDPLRRAQAVESLIIWLDTHGRDLLLHPTEPGLDVKTPIATALASALSDVSTFEGKLAFEREVEAVGDFLGPSVESSSQTDANTTRRIDGFTRATLSKLLNAQSLATNSTPSRADITEWLDEWVKLPAMPMPDMPDGFKLPD